MKKLILILFVGVVFGCTTENKVEFEFSCGKQLSDNEIKKYIPNNLLDYSADDLDLLADITTLVFDNNSDTSVYEVFYNYRNNETLVLDVFGVENYKQIDTTFCGLVNNQNLNLPQSLTILFHRYANGYEDGGIVVGLTSNTKEHSQE